MIAIWGVHNDKLTTELVQGGFISVGWDAIGNLRTIPEGREGLKGELARLFPEAKPRAIAGWAGILTRLRDEMHSGDVVVESSGQGRNRWLNELDVTG